MTMAPAVAAKAAVLGFPVAHSLSPRLHRYWLRHYKIEGSYEAAEVAPDSLAAFLRSLPMQNFRGVNLTVPHKEKALEILNHIGGRLSPAARRIGAVNTIVVHDDGGLEGANTDPFGFSENLVDAGYVQGRRPAAVLGAGGAARAVIAALIDMRCPEIRILNRTSARAENLAREFAGYPQCRLVTCAWNDPEALRDIALLVNATSLGMKNQPPLEIKLDALPPDALVNDIVYAPLQTPLLQEATRRGNKTVDGLGMLLHQARPAFSAFFGIDPEVTGELRAHVLAGMA